MGIATLDCLPHPMPIEDFPAELRTRQLSSAQLSRFPFQSLAITRVSLIVLFHHPVGTSANASDYQTSGGFFPPTVMLLLSRTNVQSPHPASHSNARKLMNAGYVRFCCSQSSPEGGVGSRVEIIVSNNDNQ